MLNGSGREDRVGEGGKNIVSTKRVGKSSLTLTRSDSVGVSESAHVPARGLGLGEMKLEGKERKRMMELEYTTYLHNKGHRGDGERCVG
jgi:hypothetical protein